MGKFFTSNQVLGRLQPIGCVAVEITQKCNLDCTLCYLSEHSQSVKDIPLQEVFNRLDQVVVHYGKGVPVQITGGDPTLRKHHELIEIVALCRKNWVKTGVIHERNCCDSAITDEISGSRFVRCCVSC